MLTNTFTLENVRRCAQTFLLVKLRSSSDPSIAVIQTIKFIVKRENLFRPQPPPLCVLAAWVRMMWFKLLSSESGSLMIDRRRTTVPFR